MYYIIFSYLYLLINEEKLMHRINNLKKNGLSHDNLAECMGICLHTQKKISKLVKLCIIWIVFKLFLIDLALNRIL